MSYYNSFCGLCKVPIKKNMRFCKECSAAVKRRVGDDNCMKCDAKLAEGGRYRLCSVCYGETSIKEPLERFCKECKISLGKVKHKQLCDTCRTSKRRKS